MSDYLVDKVYNPYSVLLYLKHKKLKNYWVATGTPTFLVKLIQSNFYDFSVIDHSEVSSGDLESFDISAKDNQGNYQQLPLPLLMLQSGYLTIESFDEDAGSYRVTYPNQEIRESLNQLILCSSLSKTNSQVDKAKKNLLQALHDKNIDLFCSVIQSLIAHVPYHMHLEKESFYHALLQVICLLLNINAQSEESVARGRADMIIQTAATMYMFEFKLNSSAKIALAQIHEKKYYEKYYTQKKDIYLVGINFNYPTKTVTHQVEKHTPAY